MVPIGDEIATDLKPFFFTLVMLLLLADAVIVAAIIGVIPGCGPQILAITAYTKGMISFPALLANAISQDGDALFPLLVRHKAASLWATIHTTLPALIAGLALLSSR